MDQVTLESATLKLLIVLVNGNSWVARLPCSNNYYFGFIKPEPKIITLKNQEVICSEILNEYKDPIPVEGFLKVTFDILVENTSYFKVTCSNIKAYFSKDPTFKEYIVLDDPKINECLVSFRYMEDV